MQKADLVAGTMGLALLGGCAGQSIDLAPSRPDRPWAPETSIEAGRNVDAQGGVERPTASDRYYALPVTVVPAEAQPETQIDPQHSYSLPELIDLAESANPLARGAWDDAKEAASGVGLARSAYLPRLTAIAAGIAETSHDNQTLDGAVIDGNGNGRSAIAAVSLQWLLFDFGQRRALVRVAQQLSTVSNIHFDAVHQKIIHDVSVSFYAAASAHDEAANAETALADALGVQAAAEKRREQGQATIVDVAQVRQTTAQARVAAVRAHGQEADARITLLTAMGISPLTPIKLAALPYRPLAAQDGIDAQVAVTRALSRRPDMLAALAMEGAADEGLNAARADFRPKVFFSSSASYQTGHLAIAAVPGTGLEGTNNLTGSSGSLVAAVGISVPLYDGGMRSAHLSQARARADGARAQMEAVRNLAVHDIVVARTAIDNSLALYAASDELLNAAQASFDAALGAYRSGVGNVTDVNAAEMALMGARNARSTAYNNALSAAASLALAAGNVAETPGI